MIVSRRLFCWVAFFLILYVSFTCFAAYKLYNSPIFSSKDDTKPVLSTHTTVIEVWGKAAIGLYLWEHLFDGNLQYQDGGSWRYGALQNGNVTYVYRTGPAVTRDTVPVDASRVIIALNGRSPEKIQYSKTWLEHLVKMPKLKSSAIVMLGDEKCDNEWILPYLRSRGGIIDAVFVIYDSPLVDDKEIFQWPLGVAIYRNFPKVLPQDVDLSSTRRWPCNFFGTVYRGSSRAELMDALHFSNMCHTKIRNEWVPQETEESLQSYIDVLKQSDLTLSPVGKNTECYRFLEALSYGSIPVVEDVITPGHCDRTGNSPLRLLKKYNAPFIYVKKWSEVIHTLESEQQISHADKVKRRIRAVEWYTDFKERMRDRFLGIIKEKFML